MRCERIALDRDPRSTVERLRALVPSAESVADAVAEILAGVSAGGDAAVEAYTTQFDTAGHEPAPMRVDELELARAADELDSEVRVGLERAIENVERSRPLRSTPIRSESCASAPTRCGSARYPSGVPPFTFREGGRRIRARS